MIIHARIISGTLALSFYFMLSKTKRYMHTSSPVKQVCMFAALGGFNLVSFIYCFSFLIMGDWRCYWFRINGYCCCAGGNIATYIGNCPCNC
jgi:hypothetical protein